MSDGDPDLEREVGGAHELQVAPRQSPGGEGGGEPVEGGRQAEDQGADKRQGGNLQRHQQTQEERSGRPDAALRCEEEAGDAVPLPVIAKPMSSQCQQPDDETRSKKNFPNSIRAACRTAAAL